MVADRSQWNMASLPCPMFGMASAQVANIAAAIGCGVGIEDFLVKSWSIYPDAIASANNRRRVDDEDDCLLAPLADE